MIKCCGCKKKFDPPENDGICPKCGAFNSSAMGNSDTEVMRGEHLIRTAGSEKMIRVVLIAAVTAVFGFAAVMIGIRYGGQISGLFGSRPPSSTNSMEDEEWETFDYTWEEAGEPFAVMGGQITLTIAEAMTVEGENSKIAGFPQEDMLIAVPARLEGTGEVLSDAAGELYVRYLSGAGQYVYKKNIFPNDLTSLGLDYGVGLDMYDFSGGTEKEGNFMFFIDPEATEIDLYLSERNAEKEIQAIYRINLPVNQESGSSWESETQMTAL